MVDYRFIVLFRVVNAYFYVFCGGFMGIFDRWRTVLSNWHSSWGFPMAKVKEGTVTQWFRYEDVPVRYGVYEVNPTSAFDDIPEHVRIRHVFDLERFYSYWDGTKWGWITGSPESAYEVRDRETGWEVGELPWRGLAGS